VLGPTSNGQGSTKIQPTGSIGMLSVEATSVFPSIVSSVGLFILSIRSEFRPTGCIQVLWYSIAPTGRGQNIHKIWTHPGCHLCQSVNMFHGSIRVFLLWAQDRYNIVRVLPSMFALLAITSVPKTMPYSLRPSTPHPNHTTPHAYPQQNNGLSANANNSPPPNDQECIGIVCSFAENWL